MRLTLVPDNSIFKLIINPLLRGLFFVSFPRLQISPPLPWINRGLNIRAHMRIFAMIMIIQLKFFSLTLFYKNTSRRVSQGSFRYKNKKSKDYSRLQPVTILLLSFIFKVLKSAFQKPLQPCMSMASKIVLNNVDFVMKDKRAMAGVLDLNKTKWKVSTHSRISEPYDYKKLYFKKWPVFSCFLLPGWFSQLMHPLSKK